MNYYKYKNNLFIFLIVVFSVFISTIVWSKINLPYFNKYNVIGVYYDLNHSTYNDVFRYIFFITFPVLSFLFSLLIFKKKDLINIKNKSAEGDKSQIEAVFELNLTDEDKILDLLVKEQSLEIADLANSEITDEINLFYLQII